MAYDENLADKVRESLVHLPDVYEKAMFGGLCFMVDGKMCICVRNTELMCRVGTDEAETALERNGARQMVHGGRTMKGYVYVEDTGHTKPSDFNYWINACLKYNKVAKSSKK
ncbi:TfoX/Sxy family protein [Mucilaginibacter litoreus]|uniref:TfoX/Sxy family protein n=1 Tax=Mucilaginibacter litoreus TaxID=1048221 RepID=A0ABW3ATE7_9SPHI